MVPEGGQYLATGATLEQSLFRPQTHTLFLFFFFILIGHLRGLQISLFLSGCITEILIVFSILHSCCMFSPTKIFSHQHRLVKNSCACYGTFPYVIVSNSLAGRVSYGTDDRWFLSVARDCLFFKASRLSLEGTQPSVEGKRGSLSRESNRSEAWIGILAFTSVEVESARSFTTRPLLLHGVVLNKALVQLTIPYALPVSVFFYIQILSYKLSAVFLWGTEFHIDMKSYAELYL
jgi:hypothetical protein